MGNPSISNNPGDKGGDSDSGDTIVIEDAADKLQFPLDVHRTVFIRRRRKGTVLPGYDPNDDREKLGSSYKQGSSAINKGLTIEEEKRFLPSIINGDPNGAEWNKLSREYFADISVDVPPDNKDGTPGGLKLEIGLHYENKEEYEADLKAKPNVDGVIVNPKGFPLNVSDYVLWRYCLVYGEVANKEEDSNKSPKIRFYIYTKEGEIQAKRIALAVKKNATQAMYQNMHDREWVDYMLTNLVASDRASKIMVKDIALMSNDEKDVLLDQFVDKDPVKFHKLATDKDLSLRSFVEEAIAAGLLNRIPNTATIIHGSNTIGNSVEEAIAFLKNPKNNATYTELKAQLRVIP